MLVLFFRINAIFHPLGTNVKGGGECLLVHGSLILSPVPDVRGASRDQLRLGARQDCCTLRIRQREWLPAGSCTAKRRKLPEEAKPLGQLIIGVAVAVGGGSVVAVAVGVTLAVDVGGGSVVGVAVAVAVAVA